MPDPASSPWEVIRQIQLEQPAELQRRCDNCGRRRLCAEVASWFPDELAEWLCRPCRVIDSMVRMTGFGVFLARMFTDPQGSADVISSAGGAISGSLLAAMGTTAADLAARCTCDPQGEPHYSTCPCWVDVLGAEAAPTLTGNRPTVPVTPGQGA